MLFSVEPAVCCCVYLNNREWITPARAQLGAISPIALRPPCPGMVFNANFNISFISLRSVLWVQKTGVLEENQRPAERH